MWEISFSIVCNIDTIITFLEVVEVFQDDFIVHGSNNVVCDERLIALWRGIIGMNTRVNPNKCLSFLSAFECPGYLVDSIGFRPDMKRLSQMANAPSPKNHTDLHLLVGALQQYSRLIPNCSGCDNYLSYILTSDSFNWDEEQESTKVH